MTYHLEVKARYSEDYMHKMDPIVTFFTEIINNQAFETEWNGAMNRPLDCSLKKEKKVQCFSLANLTIPTHHLKQK